MTLVEVMIAMGLATGIALVVGELSLQARKAGVAETTKHSAEDIRRELVAHLENATAWHNTFNAPGNKAFDCLRERKDCRSSADRGQAFDLYDSANKLGFDSHTVANGYTASGARCTGFPGPGCPLRPVLSWQPICPDAQTPCVPEQIELSAKVVYDPGPNALASAKMPFNPANYSVRMIKNLSFGIPVATPTPTSTPAAPPAVVATTPPTPPSDDDQTPLEQHKKALCKTVAPMLRGRSPAQLKEVMRGMGLSDEWYSIVESELGSCPPSQ